MATNFDVRIVTVVESIIHVDSVVKHSHIEENEIIQTRLLTMIRAEIL